MRKDDNDWTVTTDPEEIKLAGWNREVAINGTTYFVDENTACISHSLLLLVDAINDKDFKKG